MTLMTMIVHAGEAKAKSFDALRAARSGDFARAECLLKEAKEALLRAHHLQTGMLQAEARGEAQPVTLLTVHAQDILMGSMLAKDLIEEIIPALGRTDSPSK